MPTWSGVVRIKKSRIILSRIRKNRWLFEAIFIIQTTPAYIPDSTLEIKGNACIDVPLFQTKKSHSQSALPFNHIIIVSFSGILRLGSAVR